MVWEVLLSARHYCHATSPSSAPNSSSTRISSHTVGVRSSPCRPNACPRRKIGLRKNAVPTRPARRRLRGREGLLAHLPPAAAGARKRRAAPGVPPGLPPTWSAQPPARPTGGRAPIGPGARRGPARRCARARARESRGDVKGARVYGRRSAAYPGGTYGRRGPALPDPRSASHSPCIARVYNIPGI